MSMDNRGPISANNSAYMAPPPKRSPWDRGTGQLRPGEGLAAMMARVAKEAKQRWETPTIGEGETDAAR